MSPPHLCWPKRYAMSPPDPCFATNVCKVATWPYLKIVETGLGFIYLWSINFWMSSWKKTDTNNTMDFFWIITRSSIHVYAMSPWTTHKYKHICNVAPWTLLCKKCMQGRHFSFFRMEGDVQCRHVTSVISIQRNQIPLRSERNLKITLGA